MSNISLSGLTEDFFKDLQEEFKNWESTASKGKPKSLWEELAVRKFLFGNSLFAFMKTR